MPSSTAPVHARITGPIVMIGFGSIGRGTLPLIERHFEYRQVALVGDRPARRTATAQKARHRLHPAGRHARKNIANC